jgi:molybdopterin molybdotransferase
VVLEEAAVPGRFLRRRGSDVEQGQILFTPGTVVSPPVLAVLASYNIPDVCVFRRPRVAILTSGDEVKEFGEPLGESDIVASSLYYLLHELQACHCHAQFFGIAPDDADAFAVIFSEALSWCDIIITTAGVSVGEHDVVKLAVERLGGNVHFWRAAVRPGKPMLVASYGRKLHFGFPGNPLSTCCNTEIFLKPFLRKIFAMEPAIMPLERLRLADSCPRDPSRLFFVHSRTITRRGERLLIPLKGQSSSNLLAHAQADSLAVIPPGPDPIREGEIVEVLPIRSGL